MDYLSEIISFILGAFGGSLVTWQVTKKTMRASGRSTVIDQSGANAGGDIVGGNQTKKP